MENEFPYHALFILYSFVMVSNRSYYTGLTYATGEVVPKFEEGRGIWLTRHLLGAPFLGGALLYLMYPPWMAWSQWQGMPSLWRWSGVVLLAASAGLYLWTHRHLGKNFTDTVYVRKIATLSLQGPYKWVRHPMYDSGMLAALGTGLTTANGFLLALGTVLMAIIMIWRTPIEEQKLLERYGDAYRQYMNRTGRYIPKI